MSAEIQTSERWKESWFVVESGGDGAESLLVHGLPAAQAELLRQMWAGDLKEVPEYITTMIDELQEHDNWTKPYPNYEPGAWEQRFEDGSLRVSRLTTAPHDAAELERLQKLLNTPDIVDFAKAVYVEALHQRERWGSEHDAGKTDDDWFWVIGYLAGKALHSAKTGNKEKLLHHLVTTAAALNNWHAQVLGASDMRRGLSAEKTAAIDQQTSQGENS